MIGKYILYTFFGISIIDYLLLVSHEFNKPEKGIKIIDIIVLLCGIPSAPLVFIIHTGIVMQKIFGKKAIELPEKGCCKICFTNLLEIAFMPCGHMPSCEECASNIKKCPICRNPIKEKKRIYI